MSRVEEALDTDQTEEEEDNGEYDVDKVARLDTIGKARDRPDNAHIGISPFKGAPAKGAIF